MKGKFLGMAEDDDNLTERTDNAGNIRGCSPAFCCTFPVFHIEQIVLLFLYQAVYLLRCLSLYNFFLLR